MRSASFLRPMLLRQRANTATQRYAAIAVAALLGAGLALASFIMVMPMIGEISKMNAKIKKSQLIMPDPVSYEKEHRELNARIEEIKKKITESKEKLFWKKDIALFLEKLKNASKEISVDFISIKPGLLAEPIRSKENNEAILMYKNLTNITVKAGYKELVSFLKRIEESDKFLRIDSIDISVEKGDIFKRNVSMVLSIFSAD